ncbi:RDD family protein [Agromyces sp. NPDC058110]|uniref:RDD family protein n=1 Tax=Agromyces sp. NPDC058110 TaxID=3346345 RepID=UPI0036D9B3D5
MSITMHVDDEPTPGLGPDGRPDPAYAAALGLVPAPSGRRAAAFALDAAIWALLALPTVFGTVALSGALVASGAETVGDLGALEPDELAGPFIAILVGQALTIVFGLVQLLTHGLRGVTVGKAALGIRSVSVVDFGKAGFWRIALRALVLWASWVVLLLIGPALMFLSGNWDPEQRGRSWLDRIGRCYAVDARRGLDPFDAKAMRHARRLLSSPADPGAAKPPSLASDRPVGEFQIPSQRSSSGVVSAGGSVETGQWAPPPVGSAAPAASPAPSPAAQPAAPAAATPPPHTTVPTPPPHTTVPLPPPPADPTAAAAVPPSAAPRQAADRIVLVLDDGTRLTASGYGLIGRAPVDASGEGAQLVPLADPSMLISKVHAEFGVDASGFWIADRGSTNGTDARHPDGRLETLRAGVRTPLAVGSEVTVGGRSFMIALETGR